MAQTMMAITGEGLGRGDDDLGRRLMIKFVGQLATLPGKPDVVAFYNAGVRLLVRGSAVVDALQALEREGTDLIACGTCVEHFGIREDLAVGRISDMREIVSAMLAAQKVISV